MIDNNVKQLLNGSNTFLVGWMAGTSDKDVNVFELLKESIKPILETYKVELWANYKNLSYLYTLKPNFEPYVRVLDLPFNGGGFIILNEVTEKVDSIEVSINLLFHTKKGFSKQVTLHSFIWDRLVGHTNFYMFSSNNIRSISSAAEQWTYTIANLQAELHNTRIYKAV